MAAAAGISAGASILSGIAGGKGASKAAKVQAAAYQKGIDETARQFNVTQGNFAPFLAAGTSALGGLGDLLGLNGNGAQVGAFDGLKASPAFTSLYDTGADTILQNASATGGLRGGNTQNSLAQFGSGLFNQVIQQQIGNLGGLVNTGTGSANSLGQYGAQASAQTAQLLSQQGQAKAFGAAAPYAAFASTVNGLGSLFGSGGQAAGFKF